MKNTGSRTQSIRTCTFPFLVMLLTMVFILGAAGPVWAKSKKKKSVSFPPVALAHAKNDEKGRASSASMGAKPGDQRGNEVAVDSYYSYSGWTYVARAKDPIKAKIIANQAIAGCKNDKIGYGQDGPQLVEVAESVGYQLGSIQQACNVDCLDFVRTCCKAAGLETSPIHVGKEEDYDEYYNPYTEYEIFRDKAHRKSPKLLKVGDILVREGRKHAAILVKNKKSK